MCRKPWEYRVTAIIAHRDSVDAIAAVLHLLRNQTEPPYTIVVDTGSCEEQLKQLDQLERDHEDIEVHLIRGRGWQGTSQPVAAAMDVGFALCQTEYAYSTHTDVFLTRPDYLEWLVSQCSERTPVVGYQMSPRPRWAHDDWKFTPSHTATMYHMPWHRRHGVNWSYCYAIEHYQADQRQIEWQCAPDTESACGIWYAKLGVMCRWIDEPGPMPGDLSSILFIGDEPNEPYSRAPLIHVRSTFSCNFYGAGSEGAEKRTEQLEKEIKAAWKRPFHWRAEPPKVPYGQLVETARKCPHRLDWKGPGGHCHRFDRDVLFDPDCLHCPLVEHIAVTPNAEF